MEIALLLFPSNEKILGFILI